MKKDNEVYRVRALKHIKKILEMLKKGDDEKNGD